MKRSKIIATVCACAVCLGILITGVIAAVKPNFNMSGKMAFNPKGVFCDISGEVYRGESYTKLERLTDDETYTLDTIKTYILGEEGNIVEQSAGTPSWSPANVPFLPTDRLIQYRLSFSNKGTTNISVIPSEIASLPTGVTATEESSATLLIEPGETAEFRLLLTLKAGAATFSSTEISMSFEILQTSDIKTNESWFTMNTSTPTQLDGLTDAYKSAAPRVLRVPETVGGNKVLTTRNSYTQSSYCFINLQPNTGYVILPESLTSIGAYSFASVKSLKSVAIPNGVKYIGEGAYQYASLISVSIPSSMINIGPAAFDETPLISVNIQKGVTKIDFYAFRSCSSLSSITIPSSVESIGRNAFAYCTSLTSIEIPSSVTSIEGYAFSGCSSLMITVDSANPNYSSLGGSLYNKDKTALIRGAGKAVVDDISSSVTSIGGYAFSDCTSLTSITIPSSVTSIVSGAFSNCTSLTSITIPNSVTSIGNYAFNGCSSLTSITIPSSVTSIGDYAFQDCPSLKYIKMSGQTLSSSYSLQTTSGKVWVTSSSASKPTSWTSNVVPSIPTSAGNLYYHQQAAWEK